MDKRPVGRPPKFNDTLIRKLEEVFAIGGSVAEACFYAGISKQSYYKNLETRQELADHFKALQEKPILKARQEVVKGLHGNPEFSLKFLERKRKKEFGLQQSLDIKQTVIDDGTTREELLSEVKRLLEPRARSTKEEANKVK